MEKYIPRIGAITSKAKASVHYVLCHRSPQPPSLTASMYITRPQSLVCGSVGHCSVNNHAPFLLCTRLAGCGRPCSSLCCFLVLWLACIVLLLHWHLSVARPMPFLFRSLDHSPSSRAATVYPPCLMPNAARLSQRRRISSFSRPLGRLSSSADSPNIIRFSIDSNPCLMLATKPANKILRSVLRR